MIATAQARAADDPPVGRLHSVWLELQGGLDAPLGNGAAALVYDPGGWWSLGAGLGLSDAQPGTTHTHYGIFGRGRLLASKNLSLAGVLSGSLADREAQRDNVLPAYGPAGREIVRWVWTPGYRVDAGLEASWALGDFALRFGGGVGFVLNQPDLEYSGPCGDVSGPSCVHYSGVQPGRLAPYLSLTLATRVGGAWLTAPGAFHAPIGAEGTVALRLRDPRLDFAWLAPPGLVQPSGSVTVAVYELALVLATVGIAGYRHKTKVAREAVLKEDLFQMNHCKEFSQLH